MAPVNVAMQQKQEFIAMVKVIETILALVCFATVGTLAAMAFV